VVADLSPQDILGRHGGQTVIQHGICGDPPNWQLIKIRGELPDLHDSVVILHYDSCGGLTMYEYADDLRRAQEVFQRLKPLTEVGRLNVISDTYPTRVYSLRDEQPWFMNEG
jgi:hypothetical protein